jgi:ribosomal protein S12 methylthiotransferase accessory factor
VAWEDGGLRSREPADTLETIRPLLSDLTGLIPRLSVYEEDGAVIAYTGQTIPNSGRLSENRRLGRRLAAVGKGETELQARLSCACEAIERYSACYQGNEEIVTASCRAVAGLSLDPTTLFGFSALQYERRDELNLLYGDFNRIPEPLPRDVPISWTPVSSVHDGEQKLVPACFGFFYFRDNEKSEPFYFGDSNGCAAGNTAEEATLQGLYELIERDACAIWWYNRLSRPEPSPLQSADDFSARALDFYARRSRSFSLIDITTDIRVPVMAAVSADARGQDIHVGLGCNLDLRIAISRAISELHQSYLISRLPNRPETATLNKDWKDWLANGSLDQYRYLRPLGQSDAADLQELSSRTVEGDLDIVLNRLESKRLNVFVQDLSRPEAILPVFRVIVPGLRHFWARFAPGRLYDAPVAMAILDSPRAEHELNPTPFFL